MIRYLDSSVLVSSLLPDDPDYAACDRLLSLPDNWTSPHALNETFATLTGGRLGMRIDADVAAQMTRESIRPCVQFVELTVDDILDAQAKARQQGVRGGGIYDYMHWVAARKARADKVSTLNIDDFQHLYRDGDAEVERLV